ncbi:MAG TPA: cell division protein FtsZ, partial [Blastocatellia bacterium]|nr:cell division protein FtsZ [Blastocatellia bacterium]
IALMGTGSAQGDNRALEATQRAISSPLLEEASIDGAKGLLVNITGGTDLTLFEVNEAMSIIHDQADEDANIIFGAVLDERLQDQMKITVIATGFDKAASAVEPVRAFPGPPAGTDPAGPRGGPGGGPTGPLADPLRHQDDVNVPAFMRKKAD